MKRVAPVLLALAASALTLLVVIPAALADAEPLPSDTASSGPWTVIAVGIVIAAVVLISVVLIRSLSSPRRRRPSTDESPHGDPDDGASPPGGAGA